jgi:hypothetical protein
MIPKRIDYEINHRIIRPYLDRDDMGWMGLNGWKVNNWNIWINTNVLMTALLAVDNTTLRDQLITKTVHSGDKWLNWYGDDGGCDEGPSYWRQAGGRLIEYLYFMNSASENQINFSSEQLLHSIGTYIYKMHIDSDRFVNFADASGKSIPDPTLVLKYGTLFNDEKLKQFASYLYQLSGSDRVLTDSAGSGDLNAFVNEISAHEMLKTITPKAPQMTESWLPDVQVITLRSQEGSPKGMFLGAKAGTNGKTFYNKIMFQMITCPLIKMKVIITTMSETSSFMSTVCLQLLMWALALIRHKHLVKIDISYGICSLNGTTLQLLMVFNNMTDPLMYPIMSNIPNQKMVESLKQI